jgi:hypothetical protein
MEQGSDFFRVIKMFFEWHPGKIKSADLLLLLFLNANDKNFQ